MFCVKPLYFSRTGYLPCGQCEGCKIAQKKEVSDRLQIEAKYHKFNYFVTLTYRPEKQPIDVVKEDLIKFNKRLAYYCGKMPQFYAVGEYGDESAHSHYHLAIFSDEDIFENIRKSWDLGRIGIEHLEPGLCSYIAGYVAKKMNKPEDPRLEGRVPEFRMCSRRPALGYNLLYELLERMSTDETFKKTMFSHIFPPYSIRMGGKNILLPRYVREKLRPLYNEVYELQEQYKNQKKERDFAIFKKIEENVQRMLIEENLWTDDDRINRFHVEEKLLFLRNERNDHLKKVKDLKKRFKL